MATAVTPAPGYCCAAISTVIPVTTIAFTVISGGYRSTGATGTRQCAFGAGTLRRWHRTGATDVVTGTWGQDPVSGNGLVIATTSAVTRARVAVNAATGNAVIDARRHEVSASVRVMPGAANAAPAAAMIEARSRVASVSEGATAKAGGGRGR